MTVNPGSIGGQIPPSGDGVVRRQADQKRDAAEQYAVLSRTVGAIQAVVSGLADAVADIAAQQIELENTIEAMPVVVTGGNSTSGFGLVSGYATYATVTLTVPAGKTLVTIMATGNAAAVDMTSGGATSMNGRITIGSSVGPAIPSSKDAGASAVNNIVAPVHNFTAAVTPEATIAVRLQISPLSAAAFPANAGNIASLAVIAAFSG